MSVRSDNTFPASKVFNINISFLATQLFVSISQESFLVPHHYTGSFVNRFNTNRSYARLHIAFHSSLVMLWLWDLSGKKIKHFPTCLKAVLHQGVLASLKREVRTSKRLESFYNNDVLPVLFFIKQRPFMDLLYQFSDTVLSIYWFRH